MGYNVYLVKTRNWFDERNRFTEADWSEIRAKHSVPDWLFLVGGKITVKNPSKNQIVQLVGIAKERGWTVQGDDGETYDEDGSPISAPAPPQPGFSDRFRFLIREYRAKKTIRKSMKGVQCPFKVGDKVRTLYRTGGVVTRVDPKGNHGMGYFEVRFPNGAILGGMFVAHGFEKEN